MKKIIGIAAIPVVCLALTGIAACSTCKDAGYMGAENNQHHMVGAYSKYTKPTPKELALFAAVYQGEPALTPIEVSKQVVAGVNYAFRCKSADGTKYEVKIFQPLPGQGSPRLISVVKGSK